MAVSRPARSLARRLITAVLVIGVIVVVAAGAVTGLRGYSHMSALKQRLDRVESLLGSQKGSAPALELVGTLRQELAGGQQDFRALLTDVDPLLPHLEFCVVQSAEQVRRKLVQPRRPFVLYAHGVRPAFLRSSTSWYERLSTRAI